ncbi:ester cyclase [Haloarchaeobius sp. DYHT-AS-18]|uniref:ester cyclase n=1 Tax=Haloarchaeobius sp. DYHT-AS-18 TaxID=3446117 RepID=UPI003EB70323
MKRTTEEIYTTLLEKGDLSVLDTDFDPGYQAIGVTGPDPMDLDQFRTFVKELRTAFPDLTITFDEEIAEGNKVVTPHTMAGTHKGEFMGVAPTNKKCEVRGISLDEFENGKLVRSESQWDSLGLLRQLGALPETVK